MKWQLNWVLLWFRCVLSRWYKFVWSNFKLLPISEDWRVGTYLRGGRLFEGALNQGVMESKKSWFRSTKVWKLPQRLSIIIILLYLIGKSIRLLFAFPLGSHANSSCSSFPDFSIPFIVKNKAPKWIWPIGTHLHPVPSKILKQGYSLQNMEQIV